VHLQRGAQVVPAHQPANRGAATRARPWTWLSVAAPWRNRLPIGTLRRPETAQPPPRRTFVHSDGIFPGGAPQ
ncbi:MAG TPA: hypothetical protein PKC18_09295, partial [Lacipirellulaceae bacterium]|nr:hypothetical protein [Lacipirellulaceae bacterium]